MEAITQRKHNARPATHEPFVSEAAEHRRYQGKDNAQQGQAEPSRAKPSQAEPIWAESKWVKLSEANSREGKWLQENEKQRRAELGQDKQINANTNRDKHGEDK